MKKIYFLILIVLFLTGCASVQEPLKVVWGSSTKALEDNRVSATTKTYSCSASAGFDKVLAIIKSREKHDIRTSEEKEGTGTKEVIEVAGYEIFIQDRDKGLIVVMGVPKSETTTEVGIFITGISANETKIEVVSLSSAAQKTVSDHIFKELDKVYSPVEEKSS